MESSSPLSSPPTNAIAVSTRTVQLWNDRTLDPHHYVACFDAIVATFRVTRDNLDPDIGQSWEAAWDQLSPF